MVAIFTPSASIAASVGPVLGIGIDVALGGESPHVFRLFRGLGGEISRAMFKEHPLQVNSMKMSYDACMFTVTPSKVFSG
jgi:hypothetical protein